MSGPGSEVSAEEVEKINEKLRREYAKLDELEKLPQGRERDALWKEIQDDRAKEEEEKEIYRLRLETWIRDRVLNVKEDLTGDYDKVLSGGLDVDVKKVWSDDSTKSMTLRQYIDDIILILTESLTESRNPEKDRDLQEVKIKKWTLLQKGARPKTGFSFKQKKPLYYPEDAEYVDWLKWGKDIMDPRPTPFGGSRRRRMKRKTQKKHKKTRRS